MIEVVSIAIAALALLHSILIARRKEIAELHQEIVSLKIEVGILKERSINEADLLDKISDKVDLLRGQK